MLKTFLIDSKKSKFKFRKMVKYKPLKKKFYIFIIYIFISWISTLEENLNPGSYLDWVNAYNPILESFSKILKINYEVMVKRHSPLYIIFLSILHKSWSKL